MRKLWQNSRGFTLLELLVAVSLLSIGLLAAVSMQEVALDKNAIANRASAGAALAQQAVEAILSINQDDPLFVTGGIGNYLFDNANPIQTVQGAGRFSATYTVVPRVGPNQESSQIVVVVAYLDGDQPRVVATYSAFKRIPML